MEGDRYQRDTAKFFGQEQDARSTGSVFHANKAAFFGEEKKTGFQIAAPAQTQAGPTVNTKSGVFKKDTAGFYGADKWEASSQGTNFQRNAAAFLGTDMPNSGERPFKIDKTKPAEKPQGGSYLNAQRLHEHENNMQRNPNFKKNMKRFHGLPSEVTRSNGPVSTANKLDAFINK